jgi:alginate O-acetyltransferase complex protein AlgI
MLFTSITFWIFFLIVFCLYWYIFKGNLKAQNLMLLLFIR